MKGTFFSKPLEWNIETVGETWQQGDALSGTLRVKNHGTDPVDLAGSGVGLGVAEIKKVQSRAEGALKQEHTLAFPAGELAPGATAELPFTFPIGANSPVTDKRASYYLSFGRNFTEGQLQVRVDPNQLFMKVLGLMDTFHRFKVKDYKASKKGVEYKLLPPTSREMANVESLLLTFAMDGDVLRMKFEFQVKKLDTSSVTTKVNKESVAIERGLAPREYSLGKGMINQDQLLKNIETVLSEIKLKNVF
jgi:hypothetical protein